MPTLPPEIHAPACELTGVLDHSKWREGNSDNCFTEGIGWLSSTSEKGSSKLNDEDPARWDFSQWYRKHDNQAWNEMGTGFLQNSCEITVIDYGNPGNLPRFFPCRVNGKDFDPDGARPITESVRASTVKELLASFPPSFFEDPPKEYSVRWINVEGICGDIIQYFLSVAHTERRHTFSSIVNLNQRPMGIIVESRDCDANFLMVLKMPSLNEEAEEMQLLGDMELFRLGTHGRTPPIDLEHIAFLLNVPKDGHCGLLITFQEGKGDTVGDVFGEVREEIKDKGSAIQRRGVQYLLVQLLMETIMSADYIMNFLAAAGEQLDVAIECDRGDSELSYCANKLHKQCAALVCALSPLQKAIEAVAVDRFEAVTGRFKPVWFSMSVQVKELCDAVILLENAALDMKKAYRDTLAEIEKENSRKLASQQDRQDKNGILMSLMLSLFTPLSFITGVFGMNFQKPNGDPGLPELAWGWSLSNSSDPESEVVRDGLPGYAYFYICVVVVATVIFLGYMRLGLIPTPCKLLVIMKQQWNDGNERAQVAKRQQLRKKTTSLTLGRIKPIFHGSETSL